MSGSKTWEQKTSVWNKTNPALSAPKGLRYCWWDNSDDRRAQAVEIAEKRILEQVEAKGWTDWFREEKRKKTNKDDTSRGWCWCRLETAFVSSSWGVPLDGIRNKSKKEKHKKKKKHTRKESLMRNISQVDHKEESHEKQISNCPQRRKKAIRKHGGTVGRQQACF